MPGQHIHAWGGIQFEYDWSILSHLRLRGMPQSFLDLKEYFTQIKSLDLLAPQYLRQRTRESDGSLGLGGQRLSAFVHEMGPQRRKELSDLLRGVYRQLDGLE